MPEHPLVWEGRKDIPSPEAVLEVLTREVLGWEGKQIAVDLGDRLGIYTPNSRK